MINLPRRRALAPASLTPISDRFAQRDIPSIVGCRAGPVIGHAPSLMSRDQQEVSMKYPIQQTSDWDMIRITNQEHFAMWFFQLKRIFLSALVVLLATALPATSLAQEENLPVVSEYVPPSEPIYGVSFYDDQTYNFSPNSPLNFPYTGARIQNTDPLFRGLDLAYTSPDFRDIEFSFAARSGYGFNTQGNLNGQYQSRELRIGRNLERTNFAEPSWYFFIADEDEALIWDPNVTDTFGSQGSRFALQDQVEIGDLQVGVAYDWNGWQTSFSYMERKVGTQVGHTSYYQDQNFVGVTVTYRHQAP